MDWVRFTEVIPRFFRMLCRLTSYQSMALAKPEKVSSFVLLKGILITTKFALRRVYQFASIDLDYSVFVVVEHGFSNARYVNVLGLLLKELSKVCC